MNPEIKRKIEQMLLDLDRSKISGRDFAEKLGGKWLGLPSCWDKEGRRLLRKKARRGHEIIKIQPHYDFPPELIEIPIKRAEKMIILGWEP